MVLQNTCCLIWLDAIECSPSPSPGICCTNYSNCFVTYSLTAVRYINDQEEEITINGEGFLGIQGNEQLTEFFGGNPIADNLLIVAFNQNDKCYLKASWGTEFFCESIGDVVEYVAGKLYSLECEECCPENGAINCSINLIEDLNFAGDKENNIECTDNNIGLQVGDRVTQLTVNSISCSSCS